MGCAFGSEALRMLPRSTRSGRKCSFIDFGVNSRCRANANLSLNSADNVRFNTNVNH